MIYNTIAQALSGIGYAHICVGTLRYHTVVTLAHVQSNPFYHPIYLDVTHVRKDTRPSPAFPHCKRRKAGRGLETRLYSPCADILALLIQSIKIHVLSENPCFTQLEENSWFSMSPLPRLYSHDIITIVELFFILTIVELLHCARTKSFCHILTQTKEKEGKNSIPWP